jgi:uncharacterized protein DUF2877
MISSELFCIIDNVQDYTLMQSINAISLAPDANDWLANSRHPRILHVFDEVCNLINERREVLSIATTQIGSGPFNIVVQDDILFSECFNVESQITVSANQLTLDNLFIDTTKAKVWNPCPDWKTLHGKRDQISTQVEQLPGTKDQFSNSLAESLAIADLRSASVAAKQLAGLGIGLTPAGDDFIMGALYAAWIIHPPEVARDLAEEITNIAAPLTTSLSAAWLRSAGRGEAGILWHNLFDALISGDSVDIQLQIAKLLSVGETSGADALAGFIGTFISYVEPEKKSCPS